MATETLAVTLLMRANQYKTEARQAATATGQIGNQATTAGTATGKLDKQMGGLASTAKFAVAGVAAGAVAKFGKDSVQAFLGFDDAMNQSIAIMGDVDDALRGDMEDAAREVGKTMRISAEEAAEAFFFLASAGLDAEQSIDAMPQVARFAQAGMFDMARATDLATDAQSALGLTVDDAGKNLENLTRVTDVFTKANVLANTSVEQIAEAMTNKAGAAMRAVGIDIEEGSAVLAAFADQGVKGAEAGTQFSIVLRDLQTRALENKDAFEAAGISVFDSNGEFRNFADIIGDLEGRLGGMSDAQKRAELSTLGFTDKSISALTTLLGTSDAIREYETELRKAGGTTEEVANKQLDSFQGQMELLKGRMEDVQITIGRALVPALIELADAAMPVIEVMGLVAEGFNDIKESSEGLKQSDNPFEQILGTLASPQGAFATFKDGIDSLTTAWGEWTGAAEEGTPISAAAAAAIEEMGTASGSSADEVEVAAKAIEHVGRASGSSAGEVDTFNEKIRQSGGAWDDVITSMEDYDDMLRRLTDPVFRAVDDQRALEEATQRYLDVIDDPDATVGEQERAMWDLVAAQMAAEESARDLPDDLQVAADHIALVGDRANITDEDMKRLRETIMSFDGLRANATIGINVVGGERIRGNINTDVVLRQHGGPLRAGQPAIVGEDGPELFIPQSSGMVVSNAQSTSTGSAVGGGQNINVFTLTWGDFVRKAADAGLEIQRYGW